MARQDPKHAALRSLEQAPIRLDADTVADDDALKAQRLAITQLLKLAPEDRAKVLAAAEALG